MQCLAERPQPNMDFAHQGVDDHLAHLGQPDQRGFLVDAWPFEMLRQKAQCAASNGLACRSSNARGKGERPAAHRNRSTPRHLLRHPRGARPPAPSRSKPTASGLAVSLLRTGRTRRRSQRRRPGCQATQKPLPALSDRSAALQPEQKTADASRRRSQHEQAQRRPRSRDDGEQQLARYLAVRSRHHCPPRRRQRRGSGTMQVSAPQDVLHRAAEAGSSRSVLDETYLIGALRREAACQPNTRRCVDGRPLGAISHRLRRCRTAPCPGCR